MTFCFFYLNFIAFLGFVDILVVLNLFGILIDHYF